MNLAVLNSESMLNAVITRFNTLHPQRINVVIWGSLAGGFGSACILVLARKLRSAPSLSSRLGTISGYTVSRACLKGMLASHSFEHVANKEQKALAELSRTEDPFDTFEMVGPEEKSRSNEQLN